MKKIIITILTFIISLFSYGISGKVTKVSDGDSFFLKSGKKSYRIRMYGVDAPELHQKYGEFSKKALEDMILNKNVNIKVINEDKYGRKVGKVFVGNKEVNLELLKNGYVFFYEYYAKNEKEYRRAYEKALEEKRGLWKYNDVESPRDYRMENKKGE